MDLETSSPFKSLFFRNEYLCFTFLYILSQLLMLAKSSFGWALFARIQNNHKPIMGYFGQHRSGRLLIKAYKAEKTRYTRTLSQQRRGHNRHSPEQGKNVSDCPVTQGRRPCASLSWVTWPVTWMTLSWQITRMTGKPSFAGRWRNTILISHIQHKTIYFF